MQFHGGFVGSLCHMTGKQRVGGEPIDFGDFYPEDNNAEQVCLNFDQPCGLLLL